jgi:hypothetical protein
MQAYRWPVLLDDASVYLIALRRDNDSPIRMLFHQREDFRNRESFVDLIAVTDSSSASVLGASAVNSIRITPLSSSVPPSASSSPDQSVSAPPPTNDASGDQAFQMQSCRISAVVLQLPDSIDLVQLPITR